MQIIKSTNITLHKITKITFTHTITQLYLLDSVKSSTVTANTSTNNNQIIIKPTRNRAIGRRTNTKLPPTLPRNQASGTGTPERRKRLSPQPAKAERLGRDGGREKEIRDWVRGSSGGEIGGERDGERWHFVERVRVCVERER